jgi:nucleotide-binding universal stress UspA family protein
MKTIRKMRILCSLDFDVNSLAALDVARDLVLENGGTLYLLHVVPSTDPFVVSALLPMERAHYFARIRLHEVARDSLGNVEHHLILRTGRPAEQIIDAAIEFEIHMVVMATHGRSGESRFCLGSVAEAVIRESPCPVLTIRGCQYLNRGGPGTAADANGS